MQNMAAAITRLQATTDALGALGARLSIGEGDTVAPEILAALDEVLAAAGAPDVGSLESQQRTMMAGMIRTAFAQSADLLDRPARGAGWSYTDPALSLPRSLLRTSRVSFPALSSLVVAQTASSASPTTCVVRTRTITSPGALFRSPNSCARSVPM